MSKRFGARPSDLIGVADSYTAYCLDEACMYILCRVEQSGRLPAALEKQLLPQDNAETIKNLMRQKGVRHFDYRGNGGGVSDAFNR